MDHNEDPFDAASIATAHHDGHTEGHLNCVAVRHGWTRKFPIPPDMLERLSYTTLEQILELHTLKLRSASLRIYVENPAGSGVWSKIRYWKDDGSLQSVLVKQFFEGRRHGDGGGPVGTDAHAHVRLEIRDGHDREDAMSVRSGFIGVGTKGGSRINLSRVRSIHGRSDWLKQRGERVVFPSSEGEEAAPPAAPQQPRSKLGTLMRFVGLRSAPRALPPRTEEDLAAEAEAREAENLRKRGWLPPRVRRIASKKRAQSPATAATTTGTGDEAGDATAVESRDETTGLVTGTDKAKTRGGRWLPRFGGETKASGSRGSLKGAQLHGTGPEIVGKPSDAFKGAAAPGTIAD